MCLEADWFVAGGTILVAIVAVFQEWIKTWFGKPKLVIEIKTETPYCHITQLTNRKTGEVVCDCLYLWLWIKNEGKGVARNVEIYAKELRRRNPDTRLERESAFPPMNLQWAHTEQTFFPIISPDMGKHCVLGHISDPTRRPQNEINNSLKLSPSQTSFFFDLIVAPNHKGHIVGPGIYNLVLQVAAENYKPKERTVELNITGEWHSQEDEMLKRGIGVRMISEEDD